jgi:hypothetical protein
MSSIAQSRAARAALDARIDAWLDEMLECFDTQLTDADFEDLRQWESSAEFTRSTDWPGWASYIGARPGGAERPVPYLVREGRRA